jgi:hypothetical protein
MTTTRRPFAGNRIPVRVKIRPLDPSRRLAPYSVPAPPAGKFKDIPDQLAIDEALALDCEVCGNCCTSDVCGSEDCTC